MKLLKIIHLVYNGYVYTDMHDGNFVYIIDEEDDKNEQAEKPGVKQRCTAV